MNGIHFFLEYPNKKQKRKGTRRKLGKHNGTVVAVFHEDYRVSRGDIIFDAYGGLFNRPNSICCGSSVSYGYLKSRCKRISEESARVIHPKLFMELDTEN